MIRIKTYFIARVRNKHINCDGVRSDTRLHQMNILCYCLTRVPAGIQSMIMIIINKCGVLCTVIHLHNDVVYTAQCAIPLSLFYFYIFHLSVSRLQGSATRTACSGSSRARCPRNPARDCHRHRPTALRRISHPCRRGPCTPTLARCPRAASTCRTAGTTITTSCANTTGTQLLTILCIMT